MGQAAKAGQHVQVAAHVHASLLGDGSRRHRVGVVVAALDAQGSRRQRPAVHDDLLGAQSPAVAVADDNAWDAGRRQRPRVAGHTHGALGIQIDALLGGDVGGHVGVAVQMVGAQVQQRGDTQPGRRQSFQLKAGQFQHVGIAPVVQQIQGRGAEVAAHRGVHAGRNRKFVNQRRHRALAVGAGDADGGRGTGPGRVEEQFDVAADGDALGPGRGNEAVVEADAGARQQPLGGVEHIQHLPPSIADQHLHVRKVSSHRVQKGRLRARVHSHHFVLRRQVAHAGIARCTQAQNDCRSLAHRNFNVARPISTSTKVMIHKRTVTRGSGQPSSSK